MAFKVGEMVKLKSGSPTMTVTHVDKNQLVHTAWFTDRGEEKAAHFPAAALEESSRAVDLKALAKDFEKIAKAKRDETRSKRK
jgi:uncharacterized protein YodC (DUF2158 family)